MSRATLFPLPPSKFLLAAALIALMSACAGAPPSIYEYLTVAPAETQVWNNFMPGSKPSCNALLHLQVTNTGEEDVVLSDPEALVIDAPSARPLRRFPAVVTVNDERLRSVVIRRGSTVTLVFRSPDYGLEPIDTGVSPQVRIAVRMNSSLDLPLVFRSPVVSIFETQ